MPARVSILPGGQDFTVDGADSILEGALRAGVPLNYGCSGGNCGLCKARLVTGQVRKTRHHDYVLTEAEKSQGYMLMCCNAPVTDVEVEADVAGGVQDIPFQQISARVKSINALTPDMILLHVQTPRANRLRFLAGQSVRLRLGDAASGVLPVASCPCDDRNLLFHVRRRPGDMFRDYIFNHLSAGDVVDIEGPKGEFVLRENHSPTLCFIAFDTGFAPINSLIEHALSLNDAEAIFLYWIGADERSIYLPNVPRAWNDALDNFHYSTRVTGFDLGNLAGKNGETLEGVLNEIVSARHEIRNSDIYIAGEASAVTVAEQFFRRMEMPNARILTASC